MDQEQRDAFASLSGQMSNVAADAREAAARAREASSAVTRLDGKFDDLSSKVDRLEKAVFGSEPPPPLSAPVVKRITEGEGDIADLTGRVLALQGEVSQVKSDVADVKSAVATVETNVKKEIADVKTETAQQTVMLTTIRDAVTGVAKSPMVKRLAYAAGALLLLWVSAKQAEIQLRHHPASAAQGQPSANTPALLDGGAP